MSQVLITGATGLVGGHLLRMLTPLLRRRDVGWAICPGCLIPMIRN